METHNAIQSIIDVFKNAEMKALSFNDLKVKTQLHSDDLSNALEYLVMMEVVNCQDNYGTLMITFLDQKLQKYN